MHHHSAVVALLIILFGWPNGIVVGNLLANLAWLPAQYLGLHLKMRMHHAAVHARLDGQDAALDAILSHLGIELPSSEPDLQSPDDSP